MARVAQAISEIVNPKPTALVPVTVGSEEIEVAALCALLARGGVRVTVANVGGYLHHIVKLAKGTDIQADKPIDFCVNEDYDVIAVPGGPGARTLGACQALTALLREQKAAGRLYAAVGEAVSNVLYHNALVEGPMAGVPDDKLLLGDLYSDDKVVIAENCVTSEGPATAIALALTLVELLRGEKVAREIANDIAFKPIKK
ncbi:Glutathione-independent glyoxalase DJR-1.2 [Phytophthora ramorum]|uniref:DJ-1/PfpI domain-containing protein n=1 Tax=Phytophthora ramorum TaxID=164328 RepID=H3GT89_PHYRM|nr:Glutathione-independent glyoxalase DJR-1.2 [Phytophthora ramorum]